MLVNVYRANPNDLHKPSDHCDGSCEHVVFYNEHAAALNELSSKLGIVESQRQLALLANESLHDELAALQSKLEELQKENAALRERCDRLANAAYPPEREWGLR